MRSVARALWIAPLLALPIALCSATDARADDPPPAADEEPPHLRILVHPDPPAPAPAPDTLVVEEPAAATPRPAARPTPPPWKPDPRCDDQACADLGRCSFVAGACAAGSSDDCEQSNACTGEGECFFDRDEQECSDGMEFESPATLAAGIAVTALGAALVTTGIYLARSTDLCVDESCTPEERESSTAAIDAGDGLAFGGVLALIAGVAAIIAGSNQVLQTERFSALPVLTAGAGGGSLSWSF